MELRNRRGFTLIEVIVVAAIIAILAGILVPMIFNQIDESKITKAKGDCKSIQSAIYSFRKDLGKWPTQKATPPNATFLYSDGYTTKTAAELATLNITHDITIASSLADHLVKNDADVAYNTDPTKGVVWKGPYMSALPADPWGNPYIIDGNGLNDTTTVPAIPVLVLSAGPDGIFQTGPGVKDPQGDDIGVLIK
jgi:general secretion pathway protein G